MRMPGGSATSRLKTGRAAESPAADARQPPSLAMAEDPALFPRASPAAWLATLLYPLALSPGFVVWLIYWVRQRARRVAVALAIAPRATAK